MSKLWAFVVPMVLVVGGCSCSNGQPADSGSAGDAGCDSTPGTCDPTPCWEGNSKHIGAYCTKGGGQCDKWNLYCAIDLDSRGGLFCLQLGCVSDSSCAENACCYQGAACIPSDCTCPPPATDAGSDAGLADAGLDAGAADSGSDAGAAD